MAGAHGFGGAGHQDVFGGACCSDEDGHNYFCLHRQSLAWWPKVEQRKHRMGSRQLEILWSRKRHQKHLPSVLLSNEVDGLCGCVEWLNAQLHATSEASSLPANRLLLRGERL